MTGIADPNRPPQRRWSGTSQPSEPSGAPTGWPADLWHAPAGPIVYPIWSVPGITTPVLSPRQWDAWARSQLARGVPIGTLLAQMVPPGADYRGAYAFLQRHAASLRRQGLAIAGVGGVITALGVLMILAVAAVGWADRDAVKGSATFLILGTVLLCCGGVRLARMSRG
jgi:hypothetical protein